MQDFCIIGGGIGGCSTAALLKSYGYRVTLLEKESYLGGCASTFKHKGYYYNAGATTLCGYGDNGIVKKLFDKIGYKPNVITSDPAITVIHNDRVIIRYQDLDRFIESLQKAYPHPKHLDFWNLIDIICREFYQLEGYYYTNRSFLRKVHSLVSYFPLIKKFWKYLYRDAKTFIIEFYGDIDKDYLMFLDAQILIVAQSTSESVNVLTAALALGYTFQANHYPLGGMGSVCESLVQDVDDLRMTTEVLSIERVGTHYEIKTENETILSKNIVLGVSNFENFRWVNDAEIRQYYGQYAHLDNHQSAFVLYLTIKNTKPFSHHYQLISDNIIPFTRSKSLFVSFSDPDDPILSPNGTLSVTASIHTDSRWWLKLQPLEYRNQKEHLKSLLIQWICDTLFVDDEMILCHFAATPKTFGHFINRTQLGGIAMERKNILPVLPSNDTPFEGFYTVGDTSYAAQGWPGIVMGAFNLLKVIRE